MGKVKRLCFDSSNPGGSRMRARNAGVSPESCGRPTSLGGNGVWTTARRALAESATTRDREKADFSPWSPPRGSLSLSLSVFAQDHWAAAAHLCLAGGSSTERTNTSTSRASSLFPEQKKAQSRLLCTITVGPPPISVPHRVRGSHLTTG